jgi:hypothetical protein
VSRVSKPFHRRGAENAEAPQREEEERGRGETSLFLSPPLSSSSPYFCGASAVKEGIKHLKL